MPESEAILVVELCNLCREHGLGKVLDTLTGYILAESIRAGEIDCLDSARRLDSLASKIREAKKVAFKGRGLHR